MREAIEKIKNEAVEEAVLLEKYDFALRQYRTKDSASDVPQIFRQIVQ